MSVIEAFGLGRSSLTKVAGWGTIGAAVFLPAGWMLSKLCTLLIQMAGRKVEAQSAVQIMQAQPPLSELIFIGISTIVVAPVIEEMLFRGILYPSVKQAGYPRVARYAVALLFATYHSNLMAFVPLFALALVLAAAYEATDNLLAPILLHAWFNAANFLVLVWQVDLDRHFRWLDKLLQ
jgi:membrane protease YdiL (CAAX protease family)